MKIMNTKIPLRKILNCAIQKLMYFNSFHTTYILLHVGSLAIIYNVVFSDEWRKIYLVEIGFFLLSEFSNPHCNPEGAKHFTNIEERITICRG